MNETSKEQAMGLQVFNNPKFGELRTSTDANGKTFFCLNDLCRALELKNVGETKKRLKSAGVILNYVGTPTKNQHGETGGIQQQEMLFIDEPNLYRCIFQSRKKEAGEFQDWVFEEVLPSIRKTGGYIAAKADDTPEEIMARALAIAQETLAKRENRIAQLEAEAQQRVMIESKEATITRQTEEIKKQAPKVKYYDETLQSVCTMTTTQVAKSLGMDAHALNRKLKDAGVIYRQSGMWMLKSPYSGWRLSAVRTQTFTRSDGSIGTSQYTVWNERGKMFITALQSNNWSPKQALHAINGEKGGMA